MVKTQKLYKENETVNTQLIDSGDNDDDLNFGGGTGEQKKEPEKKEQVAGDDTIFETPDQKVAREKAEAEAKSKEKKAKVGEDGQPLKNEKGEIIYEETRKPILDESGQQKKDEKGNLLFEEEKKNDDVFSLSEEQHKELGFIKLSEIAEKIGLELTDEKNIDDFIEKVNQKIESSKQIVELDKTKYDEGTREIFEFVENGGSAIDLIDVTKPFNAFLILSPEDQLRQVLQNLPEKPMTLVEANQYIDNLKTEGKFEAEVAATKKTVVDFREKAVNGVIQKQKDVISLRKKEEAATILKENTIMKDIVLNKKEFLGMPFPEEARKFVAHQIETGQFHKELNKGEAQVDAYLFRQYGSKIINKLQEAAKKQSNDSYDKGIEKMQSALHQSPEASSSVQGHLSPTERSASNFDSWSKNEDLKD